MSPGYPGAGYYPPANMYGMPYPGMGYMGPPPPHGMMMPPPPGYEHPQQFQQQQGGEQGAPLDGQQDAPVGQGEGNGTIPPAEVSKSIPCKSVLSALSFSLVPVVLVPDVPLCCAFF